MDDAERVGHRAHHGRQSSDGSRLAPTLGAEIVRLALDLLVREIDVRHVRCARHGIIAEACGEQLAGILVIDNVFEQRLSKSLNDPAMYLSRDQHRIDHPAEVFKHVIREELDLSGVGIHFHFADMRSEEHTSELQSPYVISYA